MDKAITTTKRGERTLDHFGEILSIKELLHYAQTVVIGAGAGLSASAGLVYSGARFEDNFADFIQKYGYRDMYTAAFTSYANPMEHWAYWSRHIYHNRYEQKLSSTYDDLLSLVADKDYFVITTNVDHCFIKAGFDKARLFYTQGDYGLWQCSVPCHDKTYDNEKTVREMVRAQSDMRVPQELVPYCPLCGEPMTMNLRVDHTFVQDKGWHSAKERYERFASQNMTKNTVYLELGVGGNTPGIIKYPFWQLVYQNERASYVCINLGEAIAPNEIKGRSICIDGDISQVLQDIKALGR